MDLHLRWLTTENFKITNETLRGGYVRSKNELKDTNKNNNLRWLATDINFKLLHIGCPIAHAATLNCVTIVQAHPLSQYTY